MESIQYCPQSLAESPACGRSWVNIAGHMWINKCPSENHHDVLVHTCARLCVFVCVLCVCFLCVYGVCMCTQPVCLWKLKVSTGCLPLWLSQELAWLTGRQAAEIFLSFCPLIPGIAAAVPSHLALTCMPGIWTHVLMLVQCTLNWLSRLSRPQDGP